MPGAMTQYALTSRSRGFGLRGSLGPLLFVTLLASGACKKTEAIGGAAKTADEPAARGAAPAATAATPAAPATTPATTPAGGASTIEYHNEDPGFALQVPAGFVANQPTQTGPGNTSLRLARDGEHSGIGTFVSVTWWKKDEHTFKQLRSQIADRARPGKLEDHEIAGGKGKFYYATETSKRMIEGELKDAKQYIGAAVVEGKDFVLTCTVESFEEPPRPGFIRACETLALRE